MEASEIKNDYRKKVVMESFRRNNGFGGIKDHEPVYLLLRGFSTAGFAVVKRNDLIESFGTRYDFYPANEGIRFGKQLCNDGALWDLPAMSMELGNGLGWETGGQKALFGIYPQ
ncbi:MAG: hypothetical protein KGH77_01935 [Candidatus Micrarchaeota archaeon]|nr:hypothetical protein [Candidatus Micrarchaeota archaeon]MDE1864169.1 hypothetical protein [Candidatus Micrarchaeota archaeon]